MSPLAALLVLLAILGSLDLSEATVYYVKPTQPCNATCPGDHLCLTLDDYTVNSTGYFTSNTVFFFLSGYHELNSSFNVSGIYNLTLMPYTEVSSVVLCPLVHDPHITVTMSFEVVSDVIIAQLTFKRVTLTFEDSSDIALTGLMISVDSEAPYNSSNPAAVISTRSSISLTDCKFLELQNTGIVSISSEITLISHSYFHLNTIAISLFGNSTMVLQGDAIFEGIYSKSYVTSIGITLRDCSIFIIEGDAAFNSWQEGAISGSGKSILNISGTVAFTHNTYAALHYIPYIASSGGAIGLNESSTAVITGDVSFTDNFALQGGAIALSNNCHLVLNGTITFTGNYGYDVGGAIFLSGGSTLVLDGDITFIENLSGEGGAIASVGDCGVILQGHVTFIGNSATNGGAIALMGNRTISLPELNDTIITFANNTAYHNGGGLYFSSLSSIILLYNVPQCVFLLLYLPSNPLFRFIDNTAGQGGDAIYGAYFEAGCVTPSEKVYTADYYLSMLNSISFFSSSFNDDPSLISSDPVKLCLCDDGSPNCSLSSHYHPDYSVYPGELFDIDAVVVGDMQGLVNSTVQAYMEFQFSSKHAELGNLQSSQITHSRKCTKFMYSLLVDITNSFDFLLTLSSGRATRHINISVLACPVGFVLSTKFCQCAPILADIATVSCNISQRSIERQGTAWIGALEQNTSHISVIYSNTCPFLYCNKDRVNIPVNQTHLDQDVQCNDNRSGILCGGCRPNYSLALGSNRCLPDCTNNSFSLIIAFAAAGMALVFFIKILNLTVSQGTLNGLIFYANIIGAQPTLVLPTGGSPASRAVSTFLAVFIAWLNLDLGIETCFLDNMDTYIKVWLQFIFPIYIWIISLIIIIISKYSTCAAHWFGNNSVPVLATLILLSYFKLLRAVIPPLSVSHVEQLNGTRLLLWSMNGNLQYLTGKHIPLFALAVAVLVLIIIPFTIVIISIQWLNKTTNYRVLCWVTKLKPFFDAFTGPLKDEHHYWVGVLLLARFVTLLIVFAYISDGNGTALVSVTFTALLVLAIPGSKYRNTGLIILEQSYILNLGLLSAGTLYVQYASFHGHQEFLFIFSVGIAFLQFVATVIYHACVQFSKPFNKIKSRISRRMRREVRAKKDASSVEQESLTEDIQVSRQLSYSGFRESLLAYVSEV